MTTGLGNSLIKVTCWRAIVLGYTEPILNTDDSLQYISDCAGLYHHPWIVLSWLPSGGIAIPIHEYVSLCYLLNVRVKLER